ncbi:MAG: hypothetical protein ACTS8W_00130 [Arsenophonus sp. NC-PY1-MAG3]
MNTYGVIIDHTTQIIYLGNKKRVRVIRCDSKRVKGSTNPTYSEDDLQMGPLNKEEKKQLNDILDIFPKLLLKS